MFRASKESGRFDQFTERARAVLRYAQEEAQQRGHNYIGTEHLLLGLTRDPKCLAAQILENLGAERERIRTSVEFIIGSRDVQHIGAVGLTPRSKKAIELAVDESRRLNVHYVGTEHMLLGLVREGDGIGGRVLTNLGVTADKVRSQLAGLTGTSSEAASAPAAREPGGVKSNVVTCRLDDASLSALDALVEAGVRSTRSDAAAWLIAAGIESHRALFDRVNATVGEIRRLRTEARSLAEQAITEGLAAEGKPEQTLDEGDAGGDEIPE